MPSKIRVLPDDTINKIAAGEVIENPASVVKELVENSLDAGSTDICIEIKGGGRQLIRITDNGSGMSQDDAVLCLERHATSKLREVEDIHTLATMGFRGEAIPSIASISKFNLLTCQGDDKGCMVMVDGGRLLSCSPAERSRGTTIEVKSLFFNVPVRKKFLKSPAIDANEILKTVSLLALGNPDIAFQLISEGKSLLHTSANQPSEAFVELLKSRIDAVLGHDFIDNLSFIDKTVDKITVQGGIGLPGYTRHNRSGQYLFINRRPVVSPLIAFAVKEGFGTALPSGRFPTFVLHLSLPGQWVDVNVHPQKREVRLRHEQNVRDLICGIVRDAVAYQPPLEPVAAPTFTFSPPPESIWNPMPAAWQSPTKRFEPTPVVPTPTYTPQQMSLPHTVVETRTSVIAPKVASTFPGYIILEAQEEHPFFNQWLRNTRRDCLILVDQKNAHARVIFEALTKKRLVQSPTVQSLLIPKNLILSPYEAAKVRFALPLLNGMGIHIHESGPHHFLIDALPQIFGNNDVDAFINDILQDIPSWEESATPSQAADLIAVKQVARSASRAAVSAHRKLSLEEAQALIGQLVQCETPAVCPFGKPTIVQLSADDLAKLFQR